MSQDKPNSSIRLRTSGAVKASLISPFNCSTISRGVADGTAMPRKPVSSKPGKVSATAGTSGVAGARFSRVIASGRSWPFCRY